MLLMQLFKWNFTFKFSFNLKLIEVLSLGFRDICPNKSLNSLEVSEADSPEGLSCASKLHYFPNSQSKQKKKKKQIITNPY